MKITGEMMMAAASATGHTIHPEDLRKALEAALSAPKDDLALSSEKFTQDELHKLFPDGIPMLFVKLLFPEKSDGLTVGELRQIARAIGSASPAGVKPKALEWRTFCSRSGNCEAKTALGEYVLQFEGLGFDASWKLYLPHEDYSTGVCYNTLEAAKSAAFADYSARIMSVIEPAGVGVETPPPSTHVTPAADSDSLHLAMAAVLKADAEFRSNMPKDWGGDPLSDELDGLRRIFEAMPAPAQHVEWGDWTVDDTDTARQILNYLGIGDDASREPGADRRRDKIAGMIRARLDAAPAPQQHVAGVSDDIRSYLEGVVGVVEANSFESMCLWQRWQEMGKSWVSTGHGYLATVGHLGDMPVCISILTATVDGEKILFIDPTSQVVDYRMVEEWLKTHVVTALRDDGYLNRADAMNFSNVLGRRAALATTEGSDNG